MKTSSTIGVLLFLFILTLSSIASAEPIQMLGARHAQISPDGTDVLVSYNGDLWIAPTAGGTARRLTDNTAYERSGVWSPDGKQVAFTSNRRGSYDVFIIPASGGSPTQLTFSQASDYVTGWSSENKILFFSYRNFRGYQLFEVDIEGGMPVALTEDDTDTSYACYTPNGDVVYSRGAAAWYRKGYYGSANFELWLLNRKTLKSRRITEYKGNDAWPATADGKTVYFASERDGIYNVYKSDMSGGDVRKVSNVREDGITSPSVSSDGKTVVYENAGRIYRIPASGGGAKEIVITVATDEKENIVSKQVFTTTDEFALSPNGKYIAFTARGDIYVTYTEDAFAPDAEPDRDLTYSRRVTMDPARDWQINWHPDSDKLIFASDRNDGQLDLYIADLRAKTVSRLTESPEDDSWPKYSHDGKMIAYNRGGNSIILLDAETHESRVVETGEVMWGAYGGLYEFSPDDQWLGYRKTIDGFNAEIFIVPVDGSTDPVNILRHPDWTGVGQWIPDGSGAVFMSTRQDDNWGIYSVDFKRKENKFTEGFILDPPADEETQEDENAQNGDETDEEKSPFFVEIDFDRIWERVTRLSNQGGFSGNPVISPDSQWVFYLSDATGELDLWVASIDGEENHQLGVYMPVDSMQFSPAGDKLYYLSLWGSLEFFRISGPQIVGGGAVPLYAEKKLDRRKELQQMYTECWRLMRNYFYDPDLHGAKKNWNKIYSKYLPLVEQAVTPEEFNYIISDLLGDIKGSHLGIWGATSFEGIPVFSGMLGLDYDLSYPGPGLRVSHVLRDGPADRNESRIKAGEIVLSIDGKAIDRTVNIYEMLDDKVSDQVDLEVRGDNGDRTVHMIPLEYLEQYQLSYREWVEERRLMTEKLSGGRIGYLHIQGMNWTSFEKFQQDLFGLNFDKEAIIIDVRYNGGGWTHNYILELLTRKAFGYSRGRFSDWVGEPAMRWERPAVCLINASSYSDAEIFPYGFKQLGIGKVIGIPTNGSVIGTGQYTLVDGSQFRMPMEGWYTIDKQNLEQAGHRGIEGVAPDIYVETNPDDVRAGKDAQLERAVRELLKEIR